MNDKNRCGIRYGIFDPTGNITALAEGDIPVEDRPAAAGKIMALHPEVEQVGFVRFFPDDDGCRIDLQMAGGEFCGNASMCAAGLYLLSNSPGDDPMLLKLRVSGASQPVFVQVCRTEADDFTASILMPPVTAIEKPDFSLGDLKAKLPLIRMGGISHVIVEPDSPFFPLKKSPQTAEEAVKTWCGMLSVECLGLMFLERNEKKSVLTPLVYVPACRTVFWERSCASGTAAAGMYLAENADGELDLILEEPGGSLRVTVEPNQKKIRLYETIRRIAGNLTL